MADRPAPILVEQAPRPLPGDPLHWSPSNVFPACWQGARFVDELYQERRISSVEWKVLRDAISPTDARTGEALLQVKVAPEATRAA